MKRPINYTPQYSLSINYLRMCMTQPELDLLIKKYVKVKIANWEKYRGRKKTREK